MPMCMAPASAHAAELHSRTAQAFDKYAEQATRDFVARAMKAAGTRRCDGVITARAGNGDGILNVPDGLIHHWLGLAFVPGATIKDVETVARDYPGYPKMYKAVLSSRVLSQKGDSYQVLLRLKEGEAGINAVLDVRSAVEYRSQKGTITAVSRSEEIRQVEDAGGSNEKLLPAGRDSGYLWRAHTFTQFVEEEDGVWVVMETLGLSRRFPRGFGHVSLGRAGEYRILFPQPALRHQEVASEALDHLRRRANELEAIDQLLSFVDLGEEFSVGFVQRIERGPNVPARLNPKRTPRRSIVLKGLRNGEHVAW